MKFNLSILLFFISILIGQQNQFAGSEACSSCHPDQYDSWKKSTHGNAGGTPNKERILAPFDGQKIELKNGWFIPFKENNRYYFRSQENGFPEKKYEVFGVVGGGHLYGGGTQSYFGLFPDGTMRLLPFDYNPERKIWFFESNNLSGWLPASKNISPRQMSEWPPNRALGTLEEKQNCQQCHGSQIITRFELSKGKYETSFTDLSINCESCHGPAKEHLEIMKFGKTIIKGYTGIKSLTTLNKEESVNLCAQCHALKDVIRPGYLPGMDFENYFSIKFSMLGDNPYHPDGRVKAFGYQQNHIFSDCYLNGSMTCIDCHNPHSNSYQDINRDPLVGRFDNGQCTSCHASIAENISNHTFHNTNSIGSQCTSCHMPFQQHQAVGNQIKFARADHTISIPRPDIDKKLGITNACSQCHAELSNNEISNQIKSWYGKLKPLHPLESALLSFNDGNHSNSDMIKLIGNNQDPTPQVFAGLAAAFMSDNANQDSKLYINQLMNLSNNKDLDIKSLALAYLDILAPGNPLLSTFTIDILSKSGKDQSKIRTRWSIALAYKAQDLSNKGLYYDGIALYKKALTIWPKNDRARRGLASIYLSINDIENAITIYGEIIKSNQLDWQAWASLANAQAINEQNDIALEAYMRSLEINTYNSSAHLGIGNILYKVKKYVLAEKHLIKSIELDQSMTDAYIYLAAIQIKRQDFKMATSYLNQGLILKPNHEIGNMMKDELDKLDE